MQKGRFYITTTTPYVNADPHIGFALEVITADVIARYHSQLGEEVVFNTGTDEHGLKIYQQAQTEKLTPQQFTDKYSQRFRELKGLLNLGFTNFIRTTEKHHEAAAQEFWRRCDAHGDIYKKLYKIKYCVGCELEKTESELVDGKCPIHPNKILEIIEEENYFFRFSRYQKQLLELYKNNHLFVLPREKYNEIVAFVAGGLQDFSISRVKAKMPWGILVPGDDAQVMYVWFDALINYISTLGWPENTDNFTNFWPGVQIAGKDNLRQQAAMWQAMLMSAGLPQSECILINGFISVDGKKMSKSLGNVIAPDEMVQRYGIDGTRYLLVRLGPIGGDMDVSWEKFDTTYNADLANGLGNLVARVAKLCQTSGFDFPNDMSGVFRTSVADALKGYRLDLAMEQIWKRISEVDKQIDSATPWKLTGAQLKSVLMELVAHLRQIGYELQPFMPQTAEKLMATFTGPRVSAPAPLFPRL